MRWLVNTLSTRPNSTRIKEALTTVTLASVVGLAACSGGPPPQLFLLDTRIGGVSTDAALTTSLEALGISQITLPGYASDERIASIQANGRIVQHEVQRWAEEPEAAITRLLSARLRDRASATVLVEPYPRDYAPQARIDILFDRLLGLPGGGAHLSGQIQLLSGNGRKLMQSVPFDIRSPALSSDVTQFLSAVALGVDDIARIAINSLLALNIKS